VVARRAHNPEVVGSNPTPATKEKEKHSVKAVLFCFILAILITLAYLAANLIITASRFDRDVLF
jgi:hypothetical protein